jgi:hypothetical protein
VGDREENNQAGGVKAAGTPREREATSDETLDDIDRTEDATVESSGDSATGEGGVSSAPSPDGAFDAGRGGDGGDAGEPM